jgi:ABC-type uncharacterized transport system substrate-binding protein
LPLRGPRDWRPVNPIGDDWVGAVFTYQSLFAMTDMFLAHATDRNQVDQLGALAIRHKLPMICSWRECTTAGGLMSYGASLPDAYRQQGIYVGRILNGEKPADLPIVQPTKFDFVLNLRAAKSLGLTVPISLQVAADKVIE